MSGAAGGSFAPVVAGKVAYLVNQYPKVSHSFIRREIQALERLGLRVERLALRGWSDDLADPQDLQERVQTRYVLHGKAGLLLDALRVALSRPASFCRAFASAARLGRRAERPLWLHLVYLLEACRILRWLEAAGVPHLHAHFGTNSAAVAMLVHELGGPGFSMTLHGPEEFDAPRALKLRDKVARSAFAVAISSYGRSQLYRWTEPTLWHKVHVVHCGVDPAFHAEPAKLAPAEHLADRRTLVCVGRLSAQKGQSLLLSAVRRVLDAGHSMDLVLAGDGELRSALEAQIRSLALGGHVRITGWVSSEEVRELLLSAKALVLPSFAEGLPVVLMEALALRVPVITTAVAGIPELVTHGESGWLVPAGDVDGLVNAITECLLTPPETLQRMGDRGRSAVLEAHDVDLEARKLAVLFGQAIASGRESSLSPA